MKSRPVVESPARELPFKRRSLSQTLARAFGLKPRADADAGAPARKHVEFESLEPRLLLSADLPLLPTAAVAAVHQDQQTPALVASVSSSTQPPAIHMSAQAAVPVSPFAGQVIYLDLDGARDVAYHGPVQLDSIDVPGFKAPAALQGLSLIHI